MYTDPMPLDGDVLEKYRHLPVEGARVVLKDGVSGVITKILPWSQVIVRLDSGHEVKAFDSECIPVALRSDAEASAGETKEAVRKAELLQMDPLGAFDNPDRDSIMQKAARLYVGQKVVCDGVTGTVVKLLGDDGVGCHIEHANGMMIVLSKGVVPLITA